MRELARRKSVGKTFHMEWSTRSRVCASLRREGRDEVRLGILEKGEWKCLRKMKKLEGQNMNFGTFTLNKMENQWRVWSTQITWPNLKRITKIDHSKLFCWSRVWWTRERAKSGRTAKERKMIVDWMKVMRVDMVRKWIPQDSMTNQMWEEQRG